MNVLRLVFQHKMLTNSLCPIRNISFSGMSSVIFIKPKENQIDNYRYWQLTPVRHKVFKHRTWPIPKNLPFHHEIPVKPCPFFDSGDREHAISPVDFSKPRMHCENLKELETADDNVKRLFTLAFATAVEVREYKWKELLSTIQQHKFDNTSEEVVIAQLTFKIRKEQEHLSKNPNNNRCKFLLNNHIIKRNKKIKLLRRADFAKFSWLMEKLGIDYKPPLLGMKPRHRSRKSDLRLVTKTYCNNLRQKKLDDYHEQLKLQQQDFLKEKKVILAQIEAQEKMLQITDGKSEK